MMPQTPSRLRCVFLSERDGNKTPRQSGVFFRAALDLSCFKAIKTLYRAVAFRLEWHFTGLSTIRAHRWEHLPWGRHLVAFGTCAIAAAGWLVAPAFFSEKRLVTFRERKILSAIAAHEGDIWHTLFKPATRRPGKGSAYAKH